MASSQWRTPQSTTPVQIKTEGTLSVRHSENYCHRLTSRGVDTLAQLLFKEFQIQGASDFVTNVFPRLDKRVFGTSADEFVRELRQKLQLSYRDFIPLCARYFSAEHMFSILEASSDVHNDELRRMTASSPSKASTEWLKITTLIFEALDFGGCLELEFDELCVFVAAIKARASTIAKKQNKFKWGDCVLMTRDLVKEFRQKNANERDRQQLVVPMSLRSFKHFVLCFNGKAGGLGHVIEILQNFEERWNEKDHSGISMWDLVVEKALGAAPLPASAHVAVLELDVFIKRRASAVKATIELKGQESIDDYYLRVSLELFSSFCQTYAYSVNYADEGEFVRDPIFQRFLSAHNNYDILGSEMVSLLLLISSRIERECYNSALALPFSQTSLGELITNAKWIPIPLEHLQLRDAESSTLNSFTKIAEQ